MLQLVLALAAPAEATTFGPMFEDAAEEFQVPEELLIALAFEASRFDPDLASAWAGYGMYDFREDNETWGPGIEQVAILLGESPDAIMVDPRLQIRGAAALLDWHADNLGGLHPDALESWAPAVAAFSAREEVHLQDLFVTYIYELVEQGIYTNEARLQPQIVNVWDTLAQLPPAPGVDYAGADDYKQAHSSNYSNYSRSGSDINYVVIHTVQGSYSGCISWFQNSQANVSAHYVVRSSDGHITQMLLEEDVGWHAGNWTYNEQSIGIEHEGYVDDAKWYTDAMYKESAKLTADIVKRTAVTANRSHVIAHSEVPSATHTDPGNNWDWAYYMDLIGGSSGNTDTAEMLGVVAVDDIYSGERLVGVTVTLDQTGETTKTDNDGYYHFENLGTGTWSVSTKPAGYEKASCAKDITSGSGQWWCSMAVTEKSEPEDTGTEPEETGDPKIEDTAAADTGLADPPGRQMNLNEGCSAVGSGALLGGWLLGLLAVARRRA